MYSLSVNDFFMVAHSLKGKEFGQAQNLHGATFEITTEYKVKKLNNLGIVIDVVVASEILKKVIKQFNYKNLDDLKEFQNLKNEKIVAASDAFFPFRDSIDTAAKSGVSAIIQPGGSIRDKEVIQAADEHGISMVFTSIRHFKH